MSVEARELMSEEWTRWQGHLVNGVYPLGRHVGGSAHSGVFLTRSATLSQGQVAIKLIPANQDQVERQLPRWTRVGSLSHPHLLPLLESGACQLEGLPYLYAVMEYADQTLAQLLQRRALTAEEAREMLPTILDALTFLHEQDLVQGELKPTNFLVVGEHLKLASDAIRRTSEGALESRTPSAYDPPEGRHGGTSTAADIWGLGISLFEALTRRAPSAGVGQRHPVVLPADFSPELRDVVAACLSQKPDDRPTVRDLVSWTKGGPLKAVHEKRNPPPAHEQPATASPAATPPATVPSEATLDRARERTAAATPKAPPLATLPSVVTLDAPRERTPVAASEAAPSRTVPSGVTLDTAQPQQASIGAAKPLAWRPLTLAAAVMIVLGLGVSAFRAHRHPETLAAPAPDELAPQTLAAAQPRTAQPPAAVAVPSTTDTERSDAVARSTLHEVIPVASRSAARSIHGHVTVSVRAVINADGSVSRVIVEQGHKSRYFQRLAVQAAKKWTFTPAPADAPRQMEIVFDFSRDGATGHAIPSAR